MNKQINTILTNNELMNKRNKYIPRGVGQGHPLGIVRGKNSEIWDVEGRRYLDFCAGIAVLNTGYSHPKIVATLHKQIDNFTHSCFQVLAYDSYINLSERLCKLAPGKTAKKAFFMTTGAEAVENAIKVARYATGRSAVIAFSGGFHGRTLFTLGLTGKVDPYKAGFGPFPAEIFHVPFPNSLHGVSSDDSLQAIEQVFSSDVEAKKVAAIIIEPVQGEGGYYQAPVEFLQKLRLLCDEHGILLIVDEVQTGIARTGKVFACEYADIEPDIITLAKGLAGGNTLSAIIGKVEIMDAASPGGLGGTYAGNPLACSAALTVLDIVEEEKLCERAIKIGKIIVDEINAIKVKVNEIADVRTLGAMSAIEFCKNGDINQPNSQMANAVKLEAQKRGLLLLTCGIYGNIIRLMMPLTITDEHLQEGIQILTQTIIDVKV